MSHDKKQYWQQRMLDKRTSMIRQMSADFEEMKRNFEWISQDQSQLNAALDIIAQGFMLLERAIKAEPPRDAKTGVVDLGKVAGNNEKQE